MTYNVRTCRACKGIHVVMLTHTYITSVIIIHRVATVMAVLYTQV